MMEIAIVGAGVAGLSVYLQLQKLVSELDNLKVVIYEKYGKNLKEPFDRGSAAESKHDSVSDSVAIVGNNIGLPPQTVQLLKYIDPHLYTVFCQRSYRNLTYRYRTARGHTIAVIPTSDGDVGSEPTSTCLRQTLWDCLLEAVDEDKIDVRSVTDVDLSGGRPILKFTDGGETAVDFVIGADGAQSVVKKALFGDSKYPTLYEGFCGIGGFIKTDLPKTVSQSRSMVFTLGPTGSFGYCSIAPEEDMRLGWWFNWWSPAPPQSNKLACEDVKSFLKDRVGTWNDPVIQKIIADMETDCVYPIWTTPDLPKWGTAKAVLLGDAAHTVQANSGLGATLALEDSVVFTLLLSRYLRDSVKPDFSDALLRSSEGLFAIQNPKAAAIKTETRRRFMTKNRIESYFVEYLFYLYVYLWTNFAILRKMVVGGVESRVSGNALEAEVENYLAKKEH